MKEYKIGSKIVYNSHLQGKYGTSYSPGINGSKEGVSCNSKGINAEKNCSSEDFGMQDGSHTKINKSISIYGTYDDNYKNNELDSSVADIVDMPKYKRFVVLSSNEKKSTIEYNCKGTNHVNISENMSLSNFSSFSSSHTISGLPLMTDSIQAPPDIQSIYSNRIHFHPIPNLKSLKSNKRRMLVVTESYFINLYHKLLPPKRCNHIKSIRNFLLPLKRIINPPTALRKMQLEGTQSLDRILKRFSHKALSKESKYHYSLQIIKKRNEILYNKRISQIIFHYWKRLTVRNSNFIDKATYFFFWKCCYDILIREGYNKEAKPEDQILLDNLDELEIIEADYIYDSRGSQNGISFEWFYLSLFELTDNWVLSTRKADYILFLKALFSEVFNSQRGLGGTEELKEETITSKKVAKILTDHSFMNTKQDNGPKISLPILPRSSSMMDINMAEVVPKLDDLKNEKSNRFEITIEEMGSGASSEVDSARIKIREEKQIEKEFIQHLNLIRRLAGTSITMSKSEECDTTNVGEELFEGAGTSQSTGLKELSHDEQSISNFETIPIQPFSGRDLGFEESQIMNNGFDGHKINSFLVSILSNNGKKLTYFDSLDASHIRKGSLSNDSRKNRINKDTIFSSSKLKRREQLPPVQVKSDFRSSSGDLILLESPDCLREFECISPFSKHSPSIRLSLKKKALDELRATYPYTKEKSFKFQTNISSKRSASQSNTKGSSNFLDIRNSKRNYSQDNNGSAVHLNSEPIL